MVDVTSLVAQGHKAVSRSDRVTAYGYYKRAENLVMNAHTSDPCRLRLIRQLNDIIDGKRASLDESIMPEVEFNPRPNSASA
jgi:hypothetical protein